MVTDHEMRMHALNLFEENERLRSDYNKVLSSWAECKELLAAERGANLAIISVAGGEVEGRPTSSINILQRIRQLVRIEGHYLEERAQKIRADR